MLEPESLRIIDLGHSFWSPAHDDHADDDDDNHNGDDDVWR